MSDEILVETRGRIAIITLNREKKLNALDAGLYYELGVKLNEIAKMDAISITILTAKGRYFSAGADVTGGARRPVGKDMMEQTVRGFVANNIFLTHAFYTHPKILVTALNGPAVGLSAALIAFSDFIYAAPHAFLLTPFTSLGLVAEGGASIGFVQRLGLAKANEALIMSKRISSEEMLHTGFVNKIIDTGKDSDKFLQEVLKEVEDRLGEHLNQDSMMKVKALIRLPDRQKLDAQGVWEVMGGLERFVSGVPQEQFRRLAAREKRHKL